MTRLDSQRFRNLPEHGDAQRFDLTASSNGAVVSRLSMQRALACVPNCLWSNEIRCREARRLCCVGIPMSIIKSILSVLAEDPVGEMPVAEVKERVLRRIASPKGTAGNAREARDIDQLQLIRRKEPTAPVDIFDRLISQPSAGIWKITDEGRAYLRSLN